MGKLVPEQRTDRNGRTQIRWVNPSLSAAARGAKIPAPAAAAPHLAARLVKRMNLPYEVVAEAVSALPQALARRLWDFYEAVGQGMPAELNTAFGRILMNGALEEPQRHAYLEALVDHYGTAKGLEPQATQAVAAVNGLHLIEAELGPLDRAQRDAVLAVVCAERNTKRSRPRRRLVSLHGLVALIPTDATQGLVALAAAHPHAAKRIVELSDAGMSDQQIAAVLDDGIATSLADGAL